jgi:N-acetylglutamate synthase-like GNAT family acetyltransferase
MKILDLTPENIATYGVCGYKDTAKHVELKNKLEWYSQYYPNGLRIKAVLSDDDTYQGMIEYMPGKIAYRPVDAKDYLFIQCLFVGFKKEYKNKGFASSLLRECIEEAKNQNLKGVSVVTRKGSFMADKNFFFKHGFEIADTAKPDFELLVLKFSSDSKNPNFNDLNEALIKYKKGLFILRSSQCPYTEKNVNAIIKTSKDKYKITPKLINLKNPEDVQNSPCAFGTFCIIFNGQILSHHPISNARFENIMKSQIHKFI